MMLSWCRCRQVSALPPVLKCVTVTHRQHYAQLDAAIKDARHHHGFGDTVDPEPWMGRRPTMIDSLPTIGPAPRHDGLYFNFGHQHIGLEK